MKRKINFQENDTLTGLRKTNKIVYLLHLQG